MSNDQLFFLQYWEHRPGVKYICMAHFICMQNNFAKNVFYAKVLTIFATTTHTYTNNVDELYYFLSI